MPYKDSIDFFVDFSGDEVVYLASGERHPRMHPRGMSGCGVFRMNHILDGEVWHPGPLQLLGVQSSYLSDSGMMRIKRSEHAAGLVDLVCGEMESRSQDDSG